LTGAATRPSREDEMKKTTETTEKKTRATRDPSAPPIRRPRAGCWTPVTRQIPIPGTQDADGNALTTPVEFYVVEFCGETIEVLKNRAGMKRANDWTRKIRAHGEEGLRVDTIRRKLEEMSEAASTQEMTARLYRASRVLAGDPDTMATEPTEPTA
jgi:hypothetical protein